MKKLYEDAIVVDVDDSTGKRKCKVALTTYGKDNKNNWNVITDWIRPYQPAFGSGAEGIYSRLGIDDYVIVSYKDYPICQDPFIIFKDTTNNSDNIEVTTDKIIKFNDAKIIFKPDGSIEFDGAFSDITINELDILSWLNNILNNIIGNLGFPVVPNPALMLELTNALNITRTKIKFKK